MFQTALLTQDVDQLMQTLEAWDPAHFISSFVVGTYSYLSQTKLSRRPGEAAGADPMQVKISALAEAYRNRTGIHDKEPPDERLSTPEKTFHAYLEAMKNGDKAGVYSCLTGPALERMQQRIRRMSTGDMNRAAGTGDMSPRLTPLDDGESAQAFTVVMNGAERRVTFAREDGNWKISGW
jgi:hypothetical protein